jgi:hypothetical protein
MRRAESAAGRVAAGDVIEATSGGERTP